MFFCRIKWLINKMNGCVNCEFCIIFEKISETCKCSLGRCDHGEKSSVCGKKKFWIARKFHIIDHFLLFLDISRLYSAFFCYLIIFQEKSLIQLLF